MLLAVLVFRCDSQFVLLYVYVAVVWVFLQVVLGVSFDGVWFVESVVCVFLWVGPPSSAGRLLCVFASLSSALNV